MIRYVAPRQSNLISATDQNFKSLHQTLDEYLRSGVLDVNNNPESYDFEDADSVDFDKPVPQDVDVYDAACGKVDPFANVGDDSGTPEVVVTPEVVPNDEVGTK